MKWIYTFSTDRKAKLGAIFLFLCELNFWQNIHMRFLNLYQIMLSKTFLLNQIKAQIAWFLLIHVSMTTGLK